jgi:hypothetical protein
MIITRYTITRLPEANSEHNWKIEFALRPNWFSRWFLGMHFNQQQTLSGCCISWQYADGQLADYFWSLWAFGLTQKHSNLTVGESHVHSRIN